ncbi:hypothetical protein ACWKSP_34655 [Micromonosporaceae bacterium Da 78-11]
MDVEQTSGIRGRRALGAPRVTASPVAGAGAVSGPLTLAAAAAGACTLTPEPTEGPYLPPREIVRRDIAEGAAGLPLMLRVRIIAVATGAAIQGAAVNVCHCDATGVDQRWLRGVQISDAVGEVQFRTVFPGWRAGRSIHILVTAHVSGHMLHTGQFFFDEKLAGQVAGLRPYRANRTARTTNDEDLHYRAAGLLTVVPRDRYDLEAGLFATMAIAVDAACLDRAGNNTETEGSSFRRDMLG